jgi:3-oxoacyl-[acyl-carrier-protein] synthase-3
MSSVLTKIVSVGTDLPENIRDNSYYEKYLDTSDEWITQRTGIKTRHIWENAPDDAAAILGANACGKALKKADVLADSVDTVICATFTPDNFFPATATSIAHKLGITGAFAFDISAACSGFVYGLTVADSLIRSGQSKRVLLVGSEVISRTLDFNDRGTCLLFGDGAGAVLLEASEDGSGVLACENYTNGKHGDSLSLPAWGDKRTLSMNGREVFKQAVRLMPKQVNLALEKCGLTTDDLDLLIPHQANIRIIEKVGEKLGIPNEKVVINVDKFGNTSSATIPIALEEAIETGRLKRGDLFAITALGGGITAGAAVIKY